MKKMLALFLLLSLFSAMALTPASAAIQAGGYAVVNNPVYGDRLHLRQAASETAASLGKYYNGTLVRVLSVQGAWAYVQVGNEAGYMQLNYLSENTSSVFPAMPAATVINRSGALIKLSGTNTLVVMPAYSTVTVLGVTDTQAHVQYGGVTGMVNLTDLSWSEGASSLVTISPAPVRPQATEKPFVFTGPVGYHETAEWPLKLNDYTAAVNNPNPAHRLNLRVSPDKNSRSLGKYYNGVQVVINGPVEKNDKGEEWVKVSVCGLQGYMDNSFLNYETQKDPASVMPVMKVHNTNPVGNLHLRSAQSTDSASLGLFENGTKVILMGFTGEWAHVIVNGQTGFMMARYLK